MYACDYLHKRIKTLYGAIKCLVERYCIKGCSDVVEKAYIVVIITAICIAIAYGLCTDAIYDDKPGGIPYARSQLNEIGKSQQQAETNLQNAADGLDKIGGRIDKGKKSIDTCRKGIDEVKKSVSGNADYAEDAEGLIKECQQVLRIIEERNRKERAEN